MATPAAARIVDRDGQGQLSVHGLRFARIILGVVIIIASWEFLHRYVINPYLLPSPIQVLKTLWDLTLSGELLTDIVASMRRILVGYAMGCTVGIVLGLLMGRLMWFN